MTHSGGKPHSNIGDRGQRFEVTFLDGEAARRRTLGWAEDMAGARRFCDAVESHPAWTDPVIRDRLDGGAECACARVGTPICANFTQVAEVLSGCVVRATAQVAHSIQCASCRHLQFCHGRPYR